MFRGLQPNKTLEQVVFVAKTPVGSNVKYSAEDLAELSEEREFWLEYNARARAGGGRVVAQRRA